MENKTTEDHEIQTEEREMRVNGHFLKETKVTTFIDGDHDEYRESTTIVELNQIIDKFEDSDTQVTQNQRCRYIGFISTRIDGCSLTIFFNPNFLDENFRSRS